MANHLTMTLSSFLLSFTLRSKLCSQNLYIFLFVFCKNSLNAAQSSNQGEGRDEENGRAEDGKMTKQRRREPPGTGK